MSREEIELISRKLAQALTEHLVQGEAQHVQASGESLLQVYTVVPEHLIAEAIDLDLVASSIHGITDIVGQIVGFFQSIANNIVAGINAFIAGVRDAIISSVRSVGSTIIDAVADFTARVIARLIDYMGPRFIELLGAVADVITKIGAAIASAVSAISMAIATSIAQISASLSAAIAAVSTSLSLAINQVATSLSAAITMLGTSIATQIVSVSAALSQAILNVGTSLSAAIASVGVSISQTILSVSTSLSVAISQVATSISGAIVQLSMSISGAIVQLSTSLSVAINQVATSLSVAITQVATSLSTAIATLGTSLAFAISQVATSISGAILSVSAALSTAITQLGTSVIGTLGGLMATAIAGIQLLQGRVDVAVAIMRDFFPQFSRSVADNLATISRSIRESFQSVSSALLQFSERLTQTLTNNLSVFVARVLESVERVVGTILRISERTTETLVRNMDVTVKAIAETGERLGRAIANIHKEITDAVISSFNKASEAIRENFAKFMDTLRDQFTKMSDALREANQRMVDMILDTGKRTIDFIDESSRRITDTLLGNFSRFMDRLMEEMDRLSKALDQLGALFTGFVNSILELPGRFDRFVRPWAKAYWEELTKEQLKGWEDVWSEFPKMFQKGSVSGWESLAIFLREGVKARPYRSILNVDPEQGGPVTANIIAVLPEDYVLGKLKGENTVMNTTPSMLAEPFVGAFAGVVVPTIQKLWDEAIKPGIENAVKLITGGLESLAKGFFGTLKDFATNIIGMITGMATEVFKNLQELGEKIGKFFMEQFSAIQDGFNKIVANMIVPAVKSAPTPVPGMAKEEVDQLFENLSMSARLIDIHKGAFLLFSAPFWAQVPVRMAAHSLIETGVAIYQSGLPIRVNLRPFGIGVDFSIDIGKPLGATLAHSGTMITQFLDAMWQGYVYGLAIWASQPVSKVLNLWARNVLPIELPTVDQLTEMIRRVMPRIAENKEKEFRETLFLARLYTALQGFPDAVINMLFTPEQQFKMELTDRFKQKRSIPLSLMYTLPSPSDVARMVIRDVLQEEDAIVKMFAARGMNKDIAMMYYLLHFRYPPPERLWTFYTRGISKLLWATLSPEEESEAEKEAKIVGAKKPVAPAALNKDPGTIERMLKTYMKWHDFARFAWDQGWPSDNLIMIDTLADIPTKIDQRWMVRFGLYQLMSEKGVTRDSEVKEFVSKVVENSPASQVQLDLTNFCRTLQATGLHPHYVPITAVAEVINTIADERTLMRTGVISLYKEGFFDTASVHRMLTGVLSTSFKVSYFDPERRSWFDGWINVPLRYLDMEARLIGLRAIMDRALDILRDIQRDALTGYQEFIIETYEEFKGSLSKVIERVNAVYSADFEKIAGQKPPEELTLKFIEEYYQPLVASLDIWRDVWTVRRIRMWTQRWLGWLMFRIAQGVSKREEIAKLVEFMAKSAKLPEKERKYIEEVMKFMLELSLREYIPTPMQLATLAEYIKIDAATVQKALEQRLVPEEWRPLWARFIEVRPIADDVRAAISAYVRLLRAVKKEERIPESVRNAVRGAMAMIGFTDQEMKLFQLRVEMEELIAGLRESVPAPSQLATLAEYVRIPDAMIQRALEERSIAPDWRPFWAQYISIRPLVDDVRNLISSYLRALRMTDEAKAFEGVVKAYAARIGFGDEEMRILDARIQLEELAFSARQYVPTPQQLATIVEVLPGARALFPEVVKRYRISPTWQAVWAQYIDIKPLVDDMKRFLSRAEQLYIRFMVKKEDFEKIVDSVLDRLGYTDDERDFLMRTVELERWRNAWTELIGSVERLVSLSEYSPRASKYALAKMREMIDALPLPDADKNELKAMWEEYIRNRPVKSEAKLYITQLSNLYVEGLISDADFEKELNAMKEWGFSDNEIMFYKARAALMKARKMKMPVGG
jgi:phage-related protein